MAGSSKERQHAWVSRAKIAAQLTRNKILAFLLYSPRAFRAL